MAQNTYSTSTQQRQQLLFVLGTMVVSTIASVVASRLALGPKSAFFITPTLGVVLLAYTLWSRNIFMARLLIFGITVGFAELPSDYYGVVVNQTLVYPSGEPLIWVSPAYMPISWMVMMVQLGTLADAFTRWLGGLLPATLALAVVGGLNIPLFETLAHGAGWWWYQNTPMIAGITPYYVILAEVFLSMVLPFMVSRLANLGAAQAGLAPQPVAGGAALGVGQWEELWVTPVLLGLVQGTWILLTGVLAYFLVGR